MFKKNECDDAIAAFFFIYHKQLYRCGFFSHFKKFNLGKLKKNLQGAYFVKNKVKSL